MKPVPPIWKGGFIFGFMVASILRAGIYFSPENVVARQSYALIGEFPFSSAAIVNLEVPLGVSDEKYLKWSQEIRARFKNSKLVQVNFYHGGIGPKSLLAYYNGQRVILTSREVI